MLSVDFLNKEDEAEYRRYVERSFGAVIYHTLEWREILAKTYGFSPRYLVAKDDEGICGTLPLFEVATPIRGKRLVCLPLSHQVRVLADDEGALKAILDKVGGVFRAGGYKYVELRHGTELPDIPGLRSDVSYYGSVLDLRRPLDSIFHSLEKGSARWGVNKAMRSGVKVVEGRNIDDFRVFYSLEVETRRRQGSPVYPASFFDLLFKILAPLGKCSLYLAYIEGEPIAGVIVLEHNGTSIYSYSASVSEKSRTCLQPTNLLLWEAIRNAHERGNEVFDFGSSPVSNTGLIRFKKGWGTTVCDIRYSYLSNGKGVPVIRRDGMLSSLTSFALRRVPTVIFREVAPILVKEAA